MSDSSPEDLLKADTQSQEAWRRLLRSQDDLLSAIALLAQAINSTDPVLQQMYIGMRDCQNALQQLAHLLRTYAMMNASLARELSAHQQYSCLVSALRLDAE